MTDAVHQPNFRTPDVRMRQAQEVYRRLFAAAPLGFLVLSPDLRIVDGNEAYLAAVRRLRDSIAGMDMFEAFPDNPHHPEANGVRNLSASLERVLQAGRYDVMPLQRYDVQPADRPWEVRYWYPKNWPVLDDDGSVIALVHHVTDVSATVLATIASGRAPAKTDLIARADAALMAARETTQAVRRDQDSARARTRDLIKSSLP